MIRAGLATALALLALPAIAAEATLRATRPGAPPVALRATSSDTHWTIAVGGTPQTIRVETDLPDSPPWLADANGDGAADLWIPVIGGNANVAYDLWIMDPRSGQFRRAGEISGLEFSRDADRRLVSLGRDGCCAISYDFQDIGPDGRLRALFGVHRQLTESGRGASCEASAGAIAPPAATIAALCRMPPGDMPGTPLRGR